MSSRATELSRISLVLYLRGFVLLAFGAIAVRWPEMTLVSAMVTAGYVIGALGLVELALAALSTNPRGTKTLVVMHALLSVALGAISIAAELASPATVARLTAVWLLLQATFALALAGRTPVIRHGQAVLRAWSAANVLCALGVVLYSGPTLVAPLYLGAVYASVYGALQIAVGIRMHRAVTEPAPSGPAMFPPDGGPVHRASRNRP